MLVKIEARILIFPGTDFHFPSTSVPPGTFLGSATRYIKFVLRPGESLRVYASPLPGRRLWANVKSSTKPEVAYIAYRSAVRGGPSCSHRSKRGKLS